MRRATVLVLVPDTASGPRDADAVEAALRPLGEEATVRAWTGHVAEDGSDGDAPLVVVFTSGLPAQLAAARSVHARWPACHLVLLQPPQQVAAFRERMGVAPMLGRHWALVEAEGPALAATLRQALAAARQRRQLRTTLAAANQRMAQPKAVPTGDYLRLVTSEHHLANFLRYSRAAVLGVDTHGHVLFWSEGAAALMGVPAGSALGQPLAALGPWAVPLQEELGRLAVGAPRTIEQVFDRDGQPFALEALLSATPDSSGAGVGATVVLRDVTARRRAQEKLREANLTLQQLVSARTEELARSEQALMQAQKLEAVGKLTGGVAHDFNNVLQIIGSNLQLLEARLHDQPGHEGLLRAALAAVDRGARLAAQLLAFARRQPLEPVPLNISRRVADMGDLLQRALGEEVELETVLSAGLWTTLVDPHQLENVILNLSINARDAMPGGGRLTIETANTTLDEAYASELADVTAGQYVMVAVSDTGEGMSPEVAARAFEPFFTTKPEGKGTGLGLSMAYGFAKQSGGHIRIYSEPGHGTTVKLYLPRSYEKEVMLPQRAPEPVEGGSETVLVVEDDLAVQAAVVQTLQSLGYRVLRANDAQAAMTILQSGIRVDLLFTDVVMPGPMRSTELAQRAKAMFPHIAVLFTSGYTQNAIVHGGRLDPGVNLLGKPYRQEELARKVRQLLARRGADAARPTTRANPAAHAAAAASPGPLAAPAPAGAPVDSAQGRPLRVLLVEDQADLRDTTVPLLELLGCEPQAVASAEAADPLLAARRFDVLVTDVGLPGRSGIALAQDALQRDPDMTVVLCSGFGAALDLPPGLQAEILPKPYSLPQLSALLQRVRARAAIPRETSEQ